MPKKNMFTVSIQRGPVYLLAIASGPADVDENCAGIVFVAEILRRTAVRRLLFDMTAMAPQVGQTGVLEVMSTLYANMPALDKMAVLSPGGLAHGLVIEAARHRNVPVREFARACEADAWLQA